MFDAPLPDTRETTASMEQEEEMPPTVEVVPPQPEPLPRIDYVLVYDHRDLAHDARRDDFHRRIRRLGLRLEIEKVGNNSFVKIFCPFDRLCFEAEKMGLEMPLKGVRLCAVDISMLACSFLV
jgi:hypothetical protein